MILIECEFDETLLPEELQEKLKTSVGIATDANKGNEFWSYVIAAGLLRAEVQSFLSKTEAVYGVKIPTPPVPPVTPPTP